MPKRVTSPTGRDSLPTEPVRVGVARDSAIAALLRAAPLAPPRLIHSLVRLLIEDGRSSEAVEIARAHARGRGGAEGHMLSGFARHAVSRMFDLRGHAFGASWGGDLEQLTIRFGMPVRTTKSWQPGSMGTRFYSLELYDQDSRFGARKRLPIQQPSAGRLSLSGIMLAEPFAPGQLPDDRNSPLLQPLTRPAVEMGRPLGLYAEVSSSDSARRSVEVEIEARSVDRGSTLSRAVGWIGQRLGLSSRRVPTKIGWAVELRPDGPTALSLTLDLGPIEPGRYRVTIRVKDGLRGDDVAADRDFLVVTSRTSSSRRP